MSRDGRVLRCAIYTRKSSEEGLDQNFNSLDAQREACEAYIASQTHEGWKLLTTRYDDGGFSGGSLERPALQRLLSDIASGLGDLVVVYKIDRLTRCLTDFAKMVEIFDQRSTSFVSVTQHFNTTTSMGRLTLNVLLSFAQFEREVTGERIRDKIAASKVKGMWMGGAVPLGYDVMDRQLIINPVEAEQLRHIFVRYEILGSVQLLKEDLEKSNIRSKKRLSSKGKHTGGSTFSRGALYTLLKNSLYRGLVHHKGSYHPGQHEAIVSQELWDKAQATLEGNRQIKKLGTRAKHASLLAGMVRNHQGKALTPTHTAKASKRYRYYIIRSTPGIEDQQRLCIPAHDLERLIESELFSILKAKDLDSQLGIHTSEVGKDIRRTSQKLVADWPQLTLDTKRDYLISFGTKVEVTTSSVILTVCAFNIKNRLLGLKPIKSLHNKDPSHNIIRPIEASLFRHQGETRILENTTSNHEDATAPAREQLLKKIALGRQWTKELTTNAKTPIEIARRESCTESFVYDVLRLGCLSPNLVQKLVSGNSFKQLGMQSFKETFPTDWAMQNQLLG
jgi:site-specific DNA recombinase